MARKRKTARKTTAQGVVPIYYTKLDFEDRNKTIIDFTEAISSCNRNTNQRELSKEYVDENFTLAVFREYATTEPKSFELLGQLESPAYYEYWAKLARTESTPNSLRQVEGTSFYITARSIRPALIKQYPYCITLENSKLGLVIVPGIALCDMNRVVFKETLKSIFDVNTEIDSLYLYARELWVAIIRIIYHFEDAAAQNSKLEEVRYSHYTTATPSIPLADFKCYPQMSNPDVEVENLLESCRISHRNKGKKRRLADTEGEWGDEEPERRDAEDYTQSRKRQKHMGVQGRTWQDFEAELETAGKTVSAPPVSPEFADTALPFRPRK